MEIEERNQARCQSNRLRKPASCVAPGWHKNAHAGSLSLAPNQLRQAQDPSFRCFVSPYCNHRVERSLVQMGDISEGIAQLQPLFGLPPTEPVLAPPCHAAVQYRFPDSLHQPGPRPRAALLRNQSQMSLPRTLAENSLSCSDDRAEWEGARGRKSTIFAADSSRARTARSNPESRTVTRTLG